MPFLFADRRSFAQEKIVGSSESVNYRNLALLRRKIAADPRRSSRSRSDRAQFFRDGVAGKRLDPALPGGNFWKPREIEAARRRMENHAIDVDVGDRRLAADEPGLFRKMFFEHFQPRFAFCLVAIDHGGIRFPETERESARAIDAWRQPVEIPEHPFPDARVFFGILAVEFFQNFRDILQD